MEPNKNREICLLALRDRMPGIALTDAVDKK